jgi:hypothetical protein
MTFDLRESAPKVCLGLACAVGLVGAFIGLNASGFWLDELFTRWVIATDGGLGQVTSRILTDIHPPLYYAVIALWAHVFGDSETALRSFSALCGCGAILVFVLGTSQTFSLNARLFAAALATCSRFWFYQTQNARDYALCLLIGSGILVLALRILNQRSQPTNSKPTAFWGLLVLMAASALTHFYLLYECLAVLIILAVFRPSWRWPLGVAFVALLLISEAYLHFIIARYTQYSLTDNWIQNNPLWYRDNLSEVRRDTANSPALLSLAICGLAALYARLRGQGDRGAAPLLSPVMILCVGTPVIMLGGGILSSVLMSPNFTARNLLVASPFLWGFYAWLYAVGPERCRGWLKVAVTSALAVLALVMTTIIAGRTQPHNESFRESAAWIMTFPACRSVEIPVLSTGKSSWVRPGFDEVIVKAAYGGYLAGFAPLRIVPLDATSSQSLPADLRADIQRRIDGAGCPIIGWVSQGYDPNTPDALSQRWLALFDRTGASQGLAVKSFETYSYGLSRHPEPSGTAVLFMNRDQRQ